MVLEKRKRSSIKAEIRRNKAEKKKPHQTNDGAKEDIFDMKRDFLSPVISNNSNAPFLARGLAIWF